MSHVVQVVQPSGFLTELKAKQLRHQVDDLVSNGVDIILVDLQDVIFIDSSGIGALIVAQRVAQAADCQFFICSIAAQIKMLFELNKMDRLFKIFADQEEFRNAVLSNKLASE